MPKPLYNAFDIGKDYLLNYDNRRNDPYGIGNPYDVINNGLPENMHFDAFGNLGMANNNGSFSYQTYGPNHTPNVENPTTESDINPFGIASSASRLVGDTISLLADSNIKQNNSDNIFYQNALSGNTWGDVLNADAKLDSALDSIEANRKDYSGLKNNTSLINSWDENSYQNEAKGSSTGQKLASGYGEWLSDTGTGMGIGATLGSIVPGVGTAIGAGVGAAIGGITSGIKSLLNFGNQEDALDRINKKVRMANNIQTESFYNTAKNNITRMNREAFMHQHAEGGPLRSYNGIEHFNVGGTHSQNPNDGIQQGIASDGVPNKVEEGEIKYKDYIYSDRLKASKSLLKKYNLPEKYAGMTFSDICDKLQKESEDRPNDPVSIRTLEEWMSRLAGAQEEHKQNVEDRKLAKEFDNLNDKEKEALIAASMQEPIEDQQVYADGGKIYIKPENRGKFTALKERTGHSASWFKENGTPAQKKMATFALNARKWNHSDGGHLFDIGGKKNPWEVGFLYDTHIAPYDIETLTISPYDRKYITVGNKLDPNKLQKDLQEIVIKPVEKNPINNDIPAIDNITNPINNKIVRNSNIDYNFNPENLRYAPALGAGISALRAAFQPKDYTLANRLENIASQYKPKAAPHIGGYRSYTPYDINLGDAENLALEASALRANRGQNRATQNALNSAVINAAQKTAAQRNLVAQQANEANRLAVDQYNLGINQFNAQNDTKYDQINAGIENRRLNALMTAAQAADASNTAWANMYNTTHDNLFNQIGNIGQDIWNKNQMLNYLEALGYKGIVK